jgi:hypothetical protein
MVSRAWPVALVLVLFADRAGAEIPGTRVRIEVAPGLHEVRGHLTTTVNNPGREPLHEVYLWLPFNRLANPPEGMDQRNAHWIYPRSFRPGTIEVDRFLIDGREVPAGTWTYPDQDQPGLGAGQRILALVSLPRPIGPGEAAALEVSFRTRVPPRFGRLGRARGVLTLAGGFYPQVAMLTAAGWQLDGPELDQDWQVELVLPPRHHAVVNGQLVHASVAGGVIECAPGPAPYLSLVVTRRFYRHRVRVGPVVLEVLTLHRRYQPPRQETGMRDPLAPGDAGDATNWDYQGRVLATAQETLAVLEELGLAPPDGTVVRLVETPLRLEMASPVPGAALVSDRVYRITPLEQFHRLHDLQVARAVGWVALEPVVRREQLFDRDWVQDFLAQAVADSFAWSRHGGHGPGLRSLLSVGAFIPDIDQLLYAPLIEFRHLFLRPFRDEDPVRDEPWRIASAWPRGAVLHDKLVDLWSTAEVRALLERYPRDERPLGALISDHAGEEMGWFFDQWTGPYPAVNYRLVDVSSEDTADGRHRHRVTVERQGAHIREPVVVRLTERDGRAHELRWDGRGERGELTLVTDTGLERVELDPYGRLVEAMSVSGDNPMLDNVSPVRWRPPVFNGLLVYVSAAEQAWYALVDFSLRRQYDARNAVRLRLEYDPRGIAGDLFYQRGLGRLVDPDSASWNLLVGLSGLRTLGDLSGGRSDATAFGATLTVAHDTRWYRYDPMEGWGLRLGVAGYASVTDDGEWGWSLSGAVRVAGHWTPRVGHTFTGYAGGGIVVGEPLVEQLQSVSDRMMLRAFEADETLGRARIYLGVEYRWTVVHDMAINILHLAWLRAVFLAIFAAGGTVSHRDDLEGMFTTETLFTEVGAGLRALLELGGFQPYVLAVDLAYPVTPRERVRCTEDGSECVPRAPLGIYVSIQHTM